MRLSELTGNELFSFFVPFLGRNTLLNYPQKISTVLMMASQLQVSSEATMVLVTKRWKTKSVKRKTTWRL